MFDFVTERNTEQNAQIAVVGSDGLLIGEIDADGDGDAAMDPDPLGEGVNVVVPPEPYFPSTLNRSSFTSMRGKRGGVKRKKSKHHETLPHSTSRPLFQRDRCTITVIQGDPEASGRRKRTYVVASDLSEESRYAVEWGIGTVLRDGDEMLIVTVVENENKVDPPIPNPADRATKLRSQQERQGLAYILVRQATSLLQRTRLHVTVSCQAWHAKNARHMLLDIVDYNEPTMLIVGSRGIGQLKGILLGSTSHYLIQRCSVPVMVARRRLKRPPKRSAHLAKHRVHVSLAEAGIDRVAAKVDQDVAVMRDEMQRDDERRNEKEAHVIEEEGEGEEGGEEGDGAEGDGAEGEGYLGTKVRG
ncbi:adenine nucleotide alpha hydrolases-like protein [Gyrodon lividus]|nr:adenine nucleotide alpha hydrolases-like protein [Gyrodon lividus]